MISYLYIAGTIIFTVYGQIIIKWRVNKLGLTFQANSIFETCVMYFKILFDPFIFSGFLSAFVASVFWIFAMTKFELTRAYPFMSLSPALVFVFGVIILGEACTLGKIIGLFIIIIGIIVTVRY